MRKFLKVQESERRIEAMRQVPLAAPASGQAAPPKWTGGTATQVYGKPEAMRVKWTCEYCQRRNDHKLPLPVAASELFSCKFCRKPSRIGFAFDKRDGAIEDPSIPLVGMGPITKQENP